MVSRDVPPYRMQEPRGYTLVEVAIVLVVIGLLVGGIFKVQQLIHGSQIRRLIADHDGFRMAIHAFTDRYGYEPGDYNNAALNVGCTPSCLDGNGNRRVESNAIPVGGSEVHEDLLVWSHLSGAGLISGNYVMAGGAAVATALNSPVNSGGRFWQFSFDGNFGTVPTGTMAHNLKTGNQLSVDLIAQVDQRIDDGRPNTGSFQFSTFAVGGIQPTGGSTASPACTSAAVSSGAWNVINDSTNCGAASLF